MNSLIGRKLGMTQIYNDAGVAIPVTVIEAGSTTNVIPESARMLGTLRSTSEKARKRVQEGIRRVATQVAAAHECEADVVVVNGYPVTVNDAEFSDFARKVTTDLLGEDAFIDMPTPLMGAEDFSYMLLQRPGAYLWLGQAGGPSSCMVHNPRYDFNDEVLPIGASLFANMVETRLGAQD